MRKRSALLNFKHMATLAAYEHVITENLGLPSPAEQGYNTHLIYPSLIQAGVQTIILEGAGVNKNKIIEKSPFLKDRLLIKSDASSDIFYRFESILNPKKIQSGSGAEYSATLVLSSFLADLTLAIKQKSAMVTTFPIPNTADYIGIIPLDLLSQVKLLIDSIVTLDVSTPIPQSTIRKDCAQIFNEIIESNMFSNYSDAHEALESEATPRINSVEKISKKAIELKDRFHKVIDIKKTTITTLPLIGALASLVTGPIAEIIFDAIHKDLNNKKQIIIYDYGTYHRQLLTQHYVAIKNNK